MIVWDNGYSVNIVELDNQHKQLFKLANDLETAMREGRGNVVLGRIFDELVDYTARHFAREEELMAGHGYPDYEEHKRKHDAMVEKVLQLKDQAGGGQAGLTIKTMDFLANWLNKHIKGTDKEYSAHLNAKGVK